MYFTLNMIFIFAVMGKSLLHEEVLVISEFK